MPRTASDLINGELSRTEVEIRAEIISQLVFRKKVLPPEVLVRTTMSSFSKGLSKSKGLQEYAKLIIERYEQTGQWFT
jgi:hypothetical protein